MAKQHSKAVPASLLLCRRIVQAAKEGCLGPFGANVGDAYLTSEPQWLATAATGIVEERKPSKVVNIRESRFQQASQSKANNVHLLLSDLKSCSVTRNLELGKEIHAEAVENGTISSIRVATALVNMYAKCGRMVEARQVFESIRHPDLVSWNALLLGYAENGEGLIALDLFSILRSRGWAPDSMTYMAVLKACASLGQKEYGSGKTQWLECGQKFHSELGVHLAPNVQASLIDMYAKCGSMVDARQVFDSIRLPDVVLWTALLLGYAASGKGHVALDLFSGMRLHGCAPNSMTYVAALKACTSLALKDDSSGKAQCLQHGRQIHLEVGHHLNLYVQNALIDMYAKCGSMVDARLVFDSVTHPDVVSWNALLMGYAESGESLIALDLFSRMKSHGCTPNSITYVAALGACAALAQKDGTRSAEWLKCGKQIHLEIGGHLTLTVQNTLIDMYAKCGSMGEARQVFDSIEQPSVVSWNFLLLGYVENGESLLALDLFSGMKSSGCAPNAITYVAALKACGLLGALEYGRKVHAGITEFDATLVTCLVDFYAKCGSLVGAQAVFDLHAKTRDPETWNALLSGYSRFGRTESVFQLFEAMQDAGFQPNGVTVLCVLVCCSHAGLVEKAREYLEAMSVKHRLTPTIKHYTCMVDVLGRANKLDDAIALLQQMPCNPNVVTWTTVLSACHKWKNVEIGRLAFHCMVSLDEGDAATYVVMAHIYASRGMREEQEIVLGMRKKCQTWRVPSQAWWTSDIGEVHMFSAADSEHFQVQETDEVVKDPSVPDNSSTQSKPKKGFLF